MTVKPPDEAPAAIVMNDPRVDVRRVAAGEAVPADGVWCSAWTWQQIQAALEKAAGK